MSFHHMTGHWRSEYEFSHEDYLGFVYSIVNTKTNMEYVGRKQFYSKIKLPPLKGRRNKRHVQKETAWREYTGSCVKLNEDIAHHGIEHFTFTILKLCKYKSEIQYWESYLILTRGTLLDGYNGQVPKISCKPKFHR